MLILAGVVINLTLGENGIIKMTQVAKEESTKSQVQEEIQLELTGVIAEQLAQNVQITNHLIKEQLENKLQGIQISQELTGEYKGYEYWIDEEYNVHIGEKEVRTYLYKRGEEYVELTGGWKRGNYNIGTFTKANDHLNLQASFQNGGGIAWNSCQTTNSIDVTEYSKIVFKVKFDSMIFLENFNNWFSYLALALCDPQYNGYGNSNTKIAYAFDYIENDISKQIITQKIDITDINGHVYPTILFGLYSLEYEANVDIYEIWLEK